MTSWDRALWFMYGWVAAWVVVVIYVIRRHRRLERRAQAAWNMAMEAEAKAKP